MAVRERLPPEIALNQDARRRTADLITYVIDRLSGEVG
jgi:hypothetical protein